MFAQQSLQPKKR